MFKKGRFGLCGGLNGALLGYSPSWIRIHLQLSLWNFAARSTFQSQPTFDIVHFRSSRDHQKHQSPWQLDFPRGFGGSLYFEHVTVSNDASIILAI